MSPTATEERTWLQSLAERVGLGGLGRPRRREAPCPTCGHPNDLGVARWCGRCGTRLADLVVDAARREEAPPEGDRLRRVAVPAFLVLLAAALLVPAALQRPDAPPAGHSARGDAGRTGVVAIEAPSAPREVAWEVAGVTPDLGIAGLLPSDGVAMVEHLGEVAFLDLATGATIRRPGPSREPYWLARAVGDVVLRPDGRLLSLVAEELATGEVRWTAPTEGLARQTALDAVRVGDDVVVPSGTGSLQRLALADGAERWATDLAAAHGLGLVRVLGASGDHLVSGVVSPPGGQVALGSAARAGLAGVSLDDGTLTWAFEVPLGAALSPLAVGDGLVAHLDDVRGPDPVVVVRDAATGAELASLPLDGGLLDLAIVDGVVAVASTNGLRGWADRGTTEAFALDLPLAGGALLTAAEPPRVVVPTRDGLAVVDPAGTVTAVVETSARAPIEVGASTFTVAGPLVLVDGVLVGADDDLTLRAWDLAGNQLWSQGLRAPALAGLAADGELVAANGPEGLVVVDARKGDRVTSIERLDDGPRFPVPGSVALDEGIAVTSPFGGAQDGRGLTAVVARTGTGAWSRDGDSPPVVGAITRTPGLAWISVQDEVHAYEVQQQGRRTFAALAGLPRGPLAVTPELVVGTPLEPVCVGRDACAQAVLALRIEDRQVAWDAPAPACGPPSVADGRVLVPTTSGPWALAVTDGGLLWSAEDGAGTGGCGPLAVGDAHVVQGEGDRVRAWDASTGAAAWSVDVGATLVTDPVLAGDEVVVGTADGDLLALDVADGEVRWQFRLPQPALVDPVVVEGRWVVLLRDGRVVGLR